MTEYSTRDHLIRLKALIDAALSNEQPMVTMTQDDHVRFSREYLKASVVIGGYSITFPYPPNPDYK